MYLIVYDILISLYVYTHVQPFESHAMAINYDGLLKELTDEESKYVRHLSLIMKVFMEPFQNKSLFSQKVNVYLIVLSVLGMLSCMQLYLVRVQIIDDIFGDIPKLHELSIHLLDSLDECIETAGEVEGPQAGFVFEELTEVT